MGTTQSEIVKCVAGAGYKWNGRLRVVMASYSGADKARAMVEGFWLTNFNTNDPKVVAVVAVVAAVAVKMKYQSGRRNNWQHVLRLGHRII